MFWEQLKILLLKRLDSFSLRKDEIFIYCVVFLVLSYDKLRVDRMRCLFVLNLV
jgi:hypothetical protein